MVKLRATPDNWQKIMDQSKAMASATKDPETRKALMNNFRTAQTFAQAKRLTAPTSQHIDGVLSKPRPPKALTLMLPADGARREVGAY